MWCAFDTDDTTFYTCTQFDIRIHMLVTTPADTVTLGAS